MVAPWVAIAVEHGTNRVRVIHSVVVKVVQISVGLAVVVETLVLVVLVVGFEVELEVDEVDEAQLQVCW